MSNSLISHEIQSFCAVNISRFFTDKEFICGTASTIYGKEGYQYKEGGGDIAFQRGSYGAYVEKIRRMRCDFVDLPAISFCF